MATDIFFIDATLLYALYYITNTFICRLLIFVKIFLNLIRNYHIIMVLLYFLYCLGYILFFLLNYYIN